jgi:mRNA interferase RelE/StbE
MYKMKQIVYSQPAIKALSKIPVKTAELLKAKIAQYAENPLSLANNVSALKARFGVYRLRVGDWRVIFKETGEIIDIVDVGSRGNVYN